MLLKFPAHDKVLVELQRYKGTSLNITLGRLVSISEQTTNHEININHDFKQIRLLKFPALDKVLVELQRYKGASLNIT